MIQAMECLAKPQKGLLYGTSIPNIYIHIHRNNITAINGNTLTLAPGLSTIYPIGSLVRDVKTITYARNAVATSTCQPLTCLTRTQGGGNAQPIVDNVTNLTFTYFLSDGVTQTANAALIREIQIDLTVQNPDLNARRMTTRVKPRSLP